MATITDISDIINLTTTLVPSGSSILSPQLIPVYKDSRIPTGGAATTPVIGQWSSLWQYAGQPSNGLIPSGGVVNSGGVFFETNVNTIGSLEQYDPVPGKQLWLLGINFASLTTGTLLIYDRLSHCANLNATLSGAMVFTGASITRYTGGVGNNIWAEIYTLIGATKTTIVANYINQNGNNATTQPANFGSVEFREAQRMIPLRLAEGDTGVRSVLSVVLSASTGTAGNFGINIIHPLCYLNISQSGVAAIRDYITGLPTVVEILPGACLSFAWYANTTAVVQIHGELTLVNK